MNELRSKDPFVRRSNARWSSAIFVPFYYIRFYLKSYSPSFFWGLIRLLGLLTLEYGTDTLSRNIGKQLPHDAA